MKSAILIIPDTQTVSGSAAVTIVTRNQVGPNVFSPSSQPPRPEWINSAGWRTTKTGLVVVGTCMSFLGPISPGLFSIKLDSKFTFTFT